VGTETIARDDLELTEGAFRALGSECRIVSDLDRTAVLRAVDRIEDLESRWSRFRPDSEISELNRRAGEWVGCSDVTISLVRRAIEAAELTGGLFNPLSLNPLIALGYDRDHRELAPGTGSLIPGVEARLPDPCDIEIVGGSIKLPADAGFDPGGIGKGMAADLLLEDMLDSEATWAYVSLGGDVAFGGTELELRGTPVKIENPFERGVSWGTTTLRSGALASSSKLIRRWEHDGATYHHLLDRSGRPAVGPRVAATVHANSTWWADVVAKCILIDPDLGEADIERWDVAAVIFDESGAVESYGWSDDGHWTRLPGGA